MSYIFYSMLEVVTLIRDRGNYINNASDATRAGDYNIDKFIYCPKIYHFYKDQDIFVEVHVLSYEVLFSFVFPVSMKALALFFIIVCETLRFAFFYTVESIIVD
jgi:hypothetical protein